MYLVGLMYFLGMNIKSTYKAIKSREDKACRDLQATHMLVLLGVRNEVKGQARGQVTEIFVCLAQEFYSFYRQYRTIKYF